MSNFKIGQDVVALSNSPSVVSQPRVKGRIYVVKDVQYCPKTGGQVINLGFLLDLKTFHNFRECSYCGMLHKNHGKHWTKSIHFAPLQTDSEEADMNEAITEVFERELFI